MTAAPESATDTRELRVLLVEDSQDDADLLLRELRRGGRAVTWRRVDTAADMLAALEAEPWDIVLSDYSMPTFSAMGALEVLRESGSDLPVIIVSGTIGEETAVEALRAGAHDFIVKGRLARLIPAIERELKEAHARREAHALQNAFIAVAGHELRTPLTILLGLSQLALKRARADTPERQSFERIEHASQRLAYVVNQIVEMLQAREYRRPLHRERAELGPLLALAADDVRPFVERREQALVVSIPEDLGAIEVDAERIRDCLNHLLFNAIKFTADRGRIELSASRTPDGGARIAVSDTGIGIDPASLRRLFEPFFTAFEWRLHTSGRFEFGTRGLGLGLSLVKAFVEMHGGEVAASSEVGRGTTITLTLPAGTQPP